MALLVRDGRRSGGKVLHTPPIPPPCGGTLFSMKVLPLGLGARWLRPIVPRLARPRPARACRVERSNPRGRPTDPRVWQRAS